MSIQSFHLLNNGMGGDGHGHTQSIFFWKGHRGGSGHIHAHFLLFWDEYWCPWPDIHFLPLPLLTRGIGGGGHDHIPPSSSWKWEAWWSYPYTLLPLLSKGPVKTMARYPVPLLTKETW